jgi:hypothetical protein
MAWLVAIVLILAQHWKIGSLFLFILMVIMQNKLMLHRQVCVDGFRGLLEDVSAAVPAWQSVLNEIH